MQEYTFVDYTTLGLFIYGLLWLAYKLTRGGKKNHDPHASRSPLRWLRNKRRHRKVHHTFHVKITKEQQDALDLLRGDESRNTHITRIVGDTLNRKIQELRADSGAKENRGSQPKLSNRGDRHAMPPFIE